VFVYTMLCIFTQVLYIIVIFMGVMEFVDILVYVIRDGVIVREWASLDAEAWFSDVGVCLNG